MRSFATSLAFAAVLVLAPAARPQEEPPKPPAPAPAPPPAPVTAPAPAEGDAAKRKETKIRKFLELTRWSESVMAGLDVAFDQQVRLGALPPEFPERFKEAADFAALERIAAEAWSEALDEPTLDALIAFHETEAGRKSVEAMLRITRTLPAKVEPWAMENAMRLLQGMGGMETEEEAEEEDAEEEPGEDGTVLGTLERAKISANETAAIATLRNLASCQAQIQTAGKIDCDRDGIGEHGTFLELTGAAEVRRGLRESSGAEEWTPARGDFSNRGTKVNPPILSPKLREVDETGVVRKSGYCYRIYLPDSDPKAARFTHETGPADRIALAGGTAGVGVDMSETTWCAYAWPEEIRATGRRAFFVNQSGDVLQSPNRNAKWEGAKAPPGNAAFLGDGITAPVAVGTRGRDGEVWKVAN